MKHPLITPVGGRIVIALGLCLALGGCTKTAPVSAPAGTPAPADTDAGTRVVNTLRGAVSIPADPRRIADASGISDILCIIGRKPV
ncbi:MAG: hypothetical protein LBO76_05645, partial [Treponema sp.]|nr:hypothetical protein [Treponema sp.]